MNCLFLNQKFCCFFYRLQQSGDAGISVILMIAFSYVIAGLSVYMVNERINGEKLQQKLCGISFLTYWGVSFLWDMMVIGHSEKLDFIYLC